MTRAIAFDLDGTLVDSVPDIAAAANATLRVLGLPERSTEQYRHWIGNGVVRLLARAITGTFEQEPPTELLQRARDQFETEYALTNGRWSRPYPHAEDTLATLSSQTPLACVTNKPYDFAVSLLRTHQLLEHFALTIGGDSLPQQKPHPAPFLHVAHHFGVEPGGVTVVGDSSNDVRAAQAAGCRVIAVSYGYNHGHEIRDESPDHVIDSLAVLPELIGAGG